FSAIFSADCSIPKPCVFVMLKPATPSGLNSARPSPSVRGAHALQLLAFSVRRFADTNWRPVQRSSPRLAPSTPRQYSAPLERLAGGSPSRALHTSFHEQLVRASPAGGVPKALCLR